ncbi:hypothetical protein ACFWPA_15120 [Rhodococcus sp. NPDC058505]|uniref:hypothetical protein n=1 Tax=unclassified Rhodococcus (in: high G+C Gram-positive bacteria) TaxID=192944 RepID=UPI003654D1A0
MGDGRGDAVLSTYRSLRLGAVILMVALAVAVLIASVVDGCVQSSISAYYFTSAHTVFVAALCALGVCLIVYKGSSDTEDVLLNFAGFLAFIVAVVPTAGGASCGPAGPLAGGGGSPDGLPEGVRTSVGAIVVAGALAQVVALMIARRDPGGRPYRAAARWATGAGWVVLAAGAACFLFVPDAFAAHGHSVAAVAMFAGLIGVVVASATSASYTAGASTYGRFYRVIARWMLATLTVIVVVRYAFPDWEHYVIVVEFLLIAQFVAYWLVQTVELWNVVDRTDLYPAGQGPPML